MKIQGVGEWGVRGFSLWKKTQNVDGFFSRKELRVDLDLEYELEESEDPVVGLFLSGYFGACDS